MFYNGLAYLDTNFYFGDDYCRKVADTIGDGKAIIYRNHSFAVVGKDVPEAMLRTYLLNQACELQLRMMSTGADIHLPSGRRAQVPLRCLLRHCGFRIRRLTGVAWRFFASSTVRIRRTATDMAASRLRALGGKEVLFGTTEAGALRGGIAATTA